LFVLAFRLALTIIGLVSVSATYAADLPIAPEVGLVEVVAHEGRWNGFSVGAFGGYSAGTFGFDSSTTPGSPLADYPMPGWMLGLNVGYHQTINNGLVLGIVVDAAKTSSYFENTSLQATIDWVGSLRGRIGFDGDFWMPYVTAGLAVSQLTEGTLTDVLFGYTLGAGAEFVVTDRLSIDALYRYSDYGVADISNFQDSFRSHNLTVGVNWRF
jgi:outer membrane immunogenic protein